MSTHKILTWALVLVVLVIGGAFGYHWYFNRIDVREFDGVVEKNDAGVLTVKGFYTLKDHPELQGQGHEHTVTVTIPADITITRTRIHLPSYEQTKGEPYNPMDLPHDDSPATLADIGTNTIIITTSTNIYHRPSFTAQSIHWYEMVFPSPAKK